MLIENTKLLEWLQNLIVKYHTVGTSPEFNRKYHTVGMAPEFNRKHHTVGMAPESNRKIPHCRNGPRI
jgi:predicted nucleotidyltransferase